MLNKIKNSINNISTPLIKLTGGANSAKNLASKNETGYNITSRYTDENSCIRISGTSVSASELDDSGVDLIKKELNRKLDELKNDLNNKKETRGWLTSAWNGIKGWFGGGDKKEENKISEYETLIKNLDSDSTNIDEVYKTVMGTELDIDEIQGLQESAKLSSSIDKDTQNAIIKELENQLEALENNFEKTKKSNGWISGAWDGFKNWTGIGASSNKTSAEIDDLKDQIRKLKNNQADLATTFKNITGKNLSYDNLNSLLSGENGTGLDSISSAGQAVSKYSEGQKMCVDIVGDIASGILAVAAVAAAPFTGGASIALAAGIGAVSKVAIKASDCIGNEKTYGWKDLGYDLVTGSINGAMAPISNGLGGAAGTSVAKSFGLEAAESVVKSGFKQAAKTASKEIVEEVVEEGIEQTVKVAGKEIIEESVEQAGKSTLKKILSKQGTEYVLEKGTEKTLKTSIGKIAAYGTDMMVDGTLSGATDGFARALGEGRIEDIPQEMLSGAAGGAIMSPIIGGGFRVAGKAGSKIGSQLNLSKNIADNVDIVAKQIDIDGAASKTVSEEVADTISDSGAHLVDEMDDGLISQGAQKTSASISNIAQKNNWQIEEITNLKDGKLSIKKIKNLKGQELNCNLDTDYIVSLRRSSKKELTNFDIITSPGKCTKITNNLPETALDALSSLKASNSKKYELVTAILENTKLNTKTKNGVSGDYITRFIKKLSSCDEALLKNVVDNNIPINIYDDLALFPNASHAQYSHGKKIVMADGQAKTDNFGAIIYSKDASGKKLTFGESYNNGPIKMNGVVKDTTESLPHELAHAHDYNTGLNNLTKQEGITTIGKENNSRFADNASFSQEFDDAITKDIMQMGEIDVLNGKEYGSTFNELLSDPDFAYYLGVNNANKNFDFNDITARKELHAQFIAYVTDGKVSNAEFSKRVESLFPNSLEFAQSVIKQADDINVKKVSIDDGSVISQKTATGIDTLGDGTIDQKIPTVLEISKMSPEEKVELLINNGVDPRYAKYLDGKLDDTQYQRIIELKQNGFEDDFGFLDIVELDDAHYQRAIELKQNGFKDEAWLSYIAGLDDAQYQRVVELKQKGFKDESLLSTIAKLDDARYKKVFDLSKKVEEDNILALIDLDPDVCDRAIALLNKNVDISEAKYIANLNEKQYERVISLLDRGIDNYRAQEIAKLGDVQYERTIELLDKGIGISSAQEYINLDNIQYEKAIGLINEGIEPKYITTLIDIAPEYHTKAIELLNKGLDTYDIKNIFEYNKSQIEAIIKFLDKNIKNKQYIDDIAYLGESELKIAIKLLDKDMGTYDILFFLDSYNNKLDLIEKLLDENLNLASLKIFVSLDYVQQNFDSIKPMISKMQKEIDDSYAIYPIELQNDAGFELIASKTVPSPDNPDVTIIKKVTMSNDGTITKSHSEIRDNQTTNWNANSKRKIVTDGEFTDITIGNPLFGTKKNKAYTDITSQVEIVKNSRGELSYVLHTKTSDTLPGAYDTTAYVLSDYPEDFDIMSAIQKGTIDDDIAALGYKKGTKTSSVIKNPDGSVSYNENHIRNGNHIKRNYTQNVDNDGNITSYDYSYKIKGANDEDLLDLKRSWIKNSNNQTTTTINGKKYVANFDDTNFEVTITKPDGSKEILTLKDKFANSSIEDLKEFYEFSKTVPADDLLTIQKNIKTIKLTDDLSSYYGAAQELSTGKNKAILSHELGHSEDFGLIYAKDLSDDLEENLVNGKFSTNGELIEIYNKEVALFRADYPEENQGIINYFSQTGGGLRNTGLSELIAEANMLFKTYGQNATEIQTRSEYLVRYFPETMAKIADLLGYK